MKRLRKKLPLIGSIALLTALAAGYVFGLAYWQGQNHPYYTFEKLILPRLVDATLVSWMLYFGGAIGSFLNVVAWRMPRGKSIGGRSECPRCGNTLKTRDNVPVLGWISLRGRCRFCSLPISRRYPIVEAMVALSLTAVGITQVYAFALPDQFVHVHSDPIRAPRLTQEALAIMTYHALALSCAWAMALIRIDGAKLPGRLIAFSSIATTLPMLAMPILMVVPWQTSRPEFWSPKSLYFDAVMRLVTALVTAVFYARVLARGLSPAADLKLDPLGQGTKRLVDLIAMLAIPSIVLGWQSMPAFIVCTTVLSFLLQPISRWIPINEAPKEKLTRRGNLERFAFAIPIMLTLHLALWRVLWSSNFWPSDRSSKSVIIVWALATLVIPMFLKSDSSDIDRSDPTDPDPSDRTDLDQSDLSPSPDELPEQESESESDDTDQRRDHPPSL